MPCLISLLLFVGPRVTVAALWLFTRWFDGVFESLFWPLMGFLLAPWTLLWYTAVMTFLGGEWNVVTIAVMGLAVLSDLSGKGAASSGA